MTFIAKIILTEEESEKLFKIIGKWDFAYKSPEAGLHLLQAAFSREDIVDKSTQHVSPIIFHGYFCLKYYGSDIDESCVDCGLDMNKFIEMYKIEKSK